VVSWPGVQYIPFAKRKVVVSNNATLPYKVACIVHFFLVRWIQLVHIHVGYKLPYCLTISHILRQHRTVVSTVPAYQEWSLYVHYPEFRIRKFLVLPDPDPSVRGTDPDPSIIKQK
jgi:hypothetical protein